MQFLYYQNNLWFDANETNKLSITVYSHYQLILVDPRSTLGSLKGHNEIGFCWVQLFTERKPLMFHGCCQSCSTCRCRVFSFDKIHPLQMFVFINFRPTLHTVFMLVRKRSMCCCPMEQGYLIVLPQILSTFLL